MAADFLKQIDWRQPWLAPLVPIATRVLQSDDWVTGANAIASDLMLANCRGLPLKFVPQSDLPTGVAYESFIFHTGGVPTRNNLHDFFNALVWLTYSDIKTTLNALQANEIARRSALQHKDRGKLRDAATIFDENALLILTSDASLAFLLREHQWQRLFVEQKSHFENHCAAYLFGHALMEKLVTPYKAITGHVWIVKTPPEVLAFSDTAKMAWMDKEIAQQLAGGFCTSDFSHLPVLGVPGWWPAQDEHFYADTSVFRPSRRPHRRMEQS